MENPRKMFLKVVYTSSDLLLLTKIKLYVFYGTAYFCVNFNLKGSHPSIEWGAMDLSHCSTDV